MSKQILSAGSIKVVLENSKIADRIFKKEDQNICAKSAMLETVVFWSRVFMPQRFDAANGKYNAHVSRQWDELKKRMLSAKGKLAWGREQKISEPRSRALMSCIWGATAVALNPKLAEPACSF